MERVNEHDLAYRSGDSGVKYLFVKKSAYDPKDKVDVR